MLRGASLRSLCQAVAHARAPEVKSAEALSATSLRSVPRFPQWFCFYFDSFLKIVATRTCGCSAIGGAATSFRMTSRGNHCGMMIGAPGTPFASGGPGITRGGFGGGGVGGIPLSMGP